MSDESSVEGKATRQHTAVQVDTNLDRRTLLIVLQRLLEVGEIPLLVCARDRTHTLDVP